MSEDRVWYAAYGSNLSRERFARYLCGGAPDGATVTHVYPGCRDPSDPLDDVADEIDLELAFGGTSLTWGGGVALVRPGPRRAKVRLYLLTREQFADVVAQENWIEPGTLFYEGPTTLDRAHVYRVVLVVGDRDGIPVVTLSQDSDVPLARPSAAYLRHIAIGLRESHALSDDEIVDYLTSAPGISGLIEADEVAGAVSF